MDIKLVIFDWGDTVMKDFPEYQGPMAEWPRVELVEGIRESLKTISKDYPICLASNAGDSDQDLMRQALERVGIGEYFTYLYTSKELGYQKPDINFFREIVSRIGVKQQECIMIGNDYLKDILPAKELGMTTCFYSTGAEKGPGPAADFIIHSMHDLETVLNHNS